MKTSEKYNALLNFCRTQMNCEECPLLGQHRNEFSKRCRIPINSEAIVVDELYDIISKPETIIKKAADVITEELILTEQEKADNPLTVCQIELERLHKEKTELDNKINELENRIQDLKEQEMRQKIIDEINSIISKAPTEILDEIHDILFQNDGN